MIVRVLLFAGAAAAALALAACDNGPSAVRTRDRAQAAGAGGVETARPATDSGADTPRAQRRSRYSDSPSNSSDLGGGLVWAASRKYSADDNAHYQFEHHAAEFGITDLKAFVAKADAFAAHPPQGVLRFERASNGDAILYDPKSQIFAVATKDGAPRTMTKKPDGLAYFEAQKAQEAAREERGRGGGDRS